MLHYLFVRPSFFAIVLSGGERSLVNWIALQTRPPSTPSPSLVNCSGYHQQHSSRKWRPVDCWWKRNTWRSIYLWVKRWKEEMRWPKRCAPILLFDSHPCYYNWLRPTYIWLEPVLLFGWDIVIFTLPFFLPDHLLYLQTDVQPFVHVVGGSCESLNRE